jgi:hypothetical protein
MPNKNNISLFGRFCIYWGATMPIVALIIVNLQYVSKPFGDTCAGYFMLAATTLQWIFSRITMDRLSTKTILIVGIIGWLIAFAILFYYYTFGGGAFGNAKFDSEL